MLVVLLNYTPPPRPPLPALEDICYQQIKFVFWGVVGFPEKLLEAHRISQTRLISIVSKPIKIVVVVVVFVVVIFVQKR